MATIPDIPITGTVIESGWGLDVRTGLTENPAYLAQAAGDVFYATGAGALARLGLGGEGALLAAGADAPEWFALGDEGKVLKAGASGPEWGNAGMKRTINAGMYCIPEGPTRGESATTSASANAYGAWQQMIASTSADLIIVGMLLDPFSGGGINYAQTQFGVGSSGNESPVCTVKHEAPATTGSTMSTFLAVPPVMFPTPIKVAAGTRIAARVADGQANATKYYVTLLCVDIDDLEDF